MQALIAQLQALGITLDHHGDKLTCRPASRLTDDLRKALRDHKEELLEYLRSSAEQSLFAYLLANIQGGGSYATLWPQVRTYCKRELSPEEFARLESAFRSASTPHAPQIREQPETRIKCKDCQHPNKDNLTCAKGHGWIGLQLLHDCPDYTSRQSSTIAR